MRRPRVAGDADENPRIAEVRRRRVFYVPGYDPFPPRRYRELYRREGAKQAEISGYSIGVRRGGGDGLGWIVDATFDGAAVTTEFSVLYWADLVRGSMRRGIAATYLAMLRTVWIYVGSGAIWRLARLRKGPLIAALYPVVALLVQLILSVGLAVATGILLAAVVPAWAAWSVAIVVFAALLRLWRAMDRRVFAYYLMHDFHYSSHLNGAYPPELEARISFFADTLRGALRDDFDEILVVGHSSGVHIAVSVLAELLRGNHEPKTGPEIAFLSLGQVVPMVSFLPDASRLRGDLELLSRQSEIPWLDVTAPGDGCSFALCDPVAVSGVALPDSRWPLVISAAFSSTLKPETYARLRHRFFRLHFQYLCAFDSPRDYDYFRITAGPSPLTARIKGRAASPGRIDRPASRYTSVAR